MDTLAWWHHHDNNWLHWVFLLEVGQKLIDQISLVLHVILSLSISVALLVSLLYDYRFSSLPLWSYYISFHPPLTIQYSEESRLTTARPGLTRSKSGQNL